MMKMIIQERLGNTMEFLRDPRRHLVSIDAVMHFLCFSAWFGKYMSNFFMVTLNYFNRGRLPQNQWI